MLTWDAQLFDRIEQLLLLLAAELTVARGLGRVGAALDTVTAIAADMDLQRVLLFADHLVINWNHA